MEGSGYYVDFNITLGLSSLPLVDICPVSTQLHCGCASVSSKLTWRSWAWVSGMENQGTAPSCQAVP